MKEIIIRPILTEKTEALRDENKERKVYVFEVAKDANKIMIKKAIEERFGVTVEKVRTAIMPSKPKYRYTRSGVIKGRKRGYKKAYVTLAPGETIELFEEV